MNMASFVFYDLTFLILFVIFASVFLYVKRRNLQTEGILLLYKTKWGVKLIDYIGGKYQRTIYFLSFISIGLGYILMAMILYLFVKTVWLYLATPIATIIRAPPLMPLIPYFPKLFGLQSIFPPFYFTYFIVAIVIVATVHEFAHGIFMRRFGIGIKSTGFAFLKYFPGIFGAFVEQDEKQMVKKPKFEQMSVLSAGVFANILTALLFFLVLWGFFSMAYAPAGVVFDNYPFSAVNISDIVMINGVAVSGLSQAGLIDSLNEEGLNKFEVGGKKYVGTKKFISEQEDENIVVLYDDAPAVNAGLAGVILEIENVKILSVDDLARELDKHSPGDEIAVKVKVGEEIQNYELVLAENEKRPGMAWIGIGFYDRSGTGISGKVYQAFSFFKEPNVYYEPNDGNFTIFIYDLLWWVILINFLVALINILPLGILDGGRFFYLTILGITKSDKLAKRMFAGITWLILMMLVVLMIKWIFSF